MPKHMPKEGVAGDGSKTAGQSSVEDTRAAPQRTPSAREGGAGRGLLRRREGQDVLEKIVGEGGETVGGGGHRGRGRLG